MFTAAENVACRRLVELALEEDLGAIGDVTSQILIPPTAEGRATMVARSPGVLAGLPAAVMVFAVVQPKIKIEALLPDGSKLERGSRIAVVTGPTRGILAGERVALNFVQHLSGIATVARTFVEAVAGLPVRILDTRKTLPGLRLLEKYAVRQGGACNHRMGLYDAILIKDNHLAAIGGLQGLLAPDFHQPLRDASMPVEIEVDRLEQLDAAFACRPAAVLLDNMGPAQLHEAVLRRNTKAPDVLLEASGGITLANVRSIAETGVDRISIGALTHSVAALDIALEYDT
jgi:nicotinate-nucleotide pyrophosphorylase (carboxylating)